MLRLTVFALVGLIMAACSGKVIMSPLSPETINKKYGDEQPIEGIIVYRAKPMVEVDEFIHINIQANPGQAGSPLVLSDQCNRVILRKIVSVVDAEHPYRLHYDHGVLESYTFGATLNSEGVLTAINWASTPDQGKTFQSVASGVSSIAGSIPKIAEQPNCTVTPIFKGYEDLPKQSEIKPYGHFK
jgi:hypothetical protein